MSTRRASGQNWHSAVAAMLRRLIRYGEVPADQIATDLGEAPVPNVSLLSLLLVGFCWA